MIRTTLHIKNLVEWKLRLKGTQVRLLFSQGGPGNHHNPWKVQLHGKARPHADSITHEIQCSVWFVTPLHIKSTLDMEHQRTDKVRQEESEHTCSSAPLDLHMSNCAHSLLSLLSTTLDMENPDSKAHVCRDVPALNASNGHRSG